jgi:hypothetical protein
MGEGKGEGDRTLPDKNSSAARAGNPDGGGSNHSRTATRSDQVVELPLQAATGVGTAGGAAFAAGVVGVSVTGTDGGGTVGVVDCGGADDFGFFGTRFRLPKRAS